MRKGIEIEVSAADRARLEAIEADRNSPQKHVWRARIILATADGCGTAAVMRRAGVSKPSVWRWQERFMSEGVDGLLHDKTRPARIPPLPKAVVEKVVMRTLEEAAPDAMTHWTAPAMAATSGLSVSSVQRIWRAHGLRPHLVRSFKLSTDPEFAAKVEDIVGLYVDPPAHAVVLSIDEKLPGLPGPTLVVGPEREEIQ
ncbi:MAG TPA: helix-turn-helix domain-containing protein, partial [Geminicoccaceae bacterium]|nr:helix-turn-helix domain-containing protein [Geminicoccaceae bacterium]